MGRLGDALSALGGNQPLRTELATLQERVATLSNLEPYGYQRRPSGNRGPSVTQESALRNSVWWACRHLRANVFSSFPLDVMRPGPDGLLYPISSPGQLVDEPWPGVDISEHFYNVEMDLSGYGNSVGLIHAKNKFGLPTQVEQFPMSAVSAKMKGPKVIRWKLGNDYYDPKDVWHRRRHTISGFDLGLSPLAYAANSIGLYASAAEFAQDWFNSGANPKGSLRNLQRDLVPPEERAAAKDEFRADTAGGDIFVHGRAWEWTPAQQDAVSAGFLETQNAKERDICRFAGTPASMVDVEITTGNITYANVTQANLQWLITEIGPEAHRTERFWSRNALPKPWVLKLNTDALLRMDTAARADLMVKLKTAGLRAPSELRALDNLPPFTDDQLAELDQHATMSGKATGGKGTAAGETDPDVDSARAQAEIVQKAYLGVGIVISADEARTMVNQAGGTLTGSLAPKQLSGEAAPWQIPV